jgi:hypothetical protein
MTTNRQLCQYSVCALLALLAAAVRPGTALALRFEFSEPIAFTPAHGLGQFHSPSGITIGDVDRDGWPDLFVADTGNNRILRVNFNTPTGDPDFELVAGGLVAPKGLDVDSQRGLLFISDTGNNVVLFKDVRDGAIDGFVAGPGSGLGEVDAPHGLAVCCGGPAAGGGIPGAPETRQLFVADTGNHRIQELALTLFPDQILVFPDPRLDVRYDLSRPGPRGISAADLDGDGLTDQLLIADTGNNQVQRATIDPLTGAATLDVLMGPGNALGQVIVPSGLATLKVEVEDEYTYYLVADTGNNRVQMGIDDGNNINWQFVGGGSISMLAPEGVAVGDINRDGRPDLVVADTGNHRLLLFAGVPEPSAVVLAAFSMTGLMLRRRRVGCSSGHQLGDRHGPAKPPILS